MNDDTDMPALSWEFAPPGTTHALWSDKTYRWYFWRVEFGETFYYRGENAGWTKHAQQEQSIAKLSNSVKRPIQKPKPKKNTGMNLRGEIERREIMPTVKVTGVTVSHIWDDESQSDYEIRCGRFDGTGHYVSLKDDGNMVFIRPDSWPEIRDQIQCMMDELEATNDQ